MNNEKKKRENEKRKTKREIYIGSKNRNIINISNLELLSNFNSLELCIIVSVDSFFRSL